MDGMNGINVSTVLLFLQLATYIQQCDMCLVSTYCSSVSSTLEKKLHKLEHSFVWHTYAGFLGKQAV